MTRLIFLVLLAVSLTGLSACASQKKTNTPETPAVISTVTNPNATAELADMQRAMGKGAVLPQQTASATPKETDEAKPAATPAAKTTETVELPKKVTESSPSNTTGKPACPGVEVLPETRSITYFEDPMRIAPGQDIARASITRIRGGCNYTGNMVEVDVDMMLRGKITDKARTAPGDADSFMTFPYFVAVSDPQGNLLDKQILATAIRFPAKKTDVDSSETVRQKFAVMSPEMGQNYTITIGFQLTREQLEFNARETVKPDAQPIEAGTKKMEPVQ